MGNRIQTQYERMIELPLTNFEKMHVAPKDLDYPVGSVLFNVTYNRNPEGFEVIYYDPITGRSEVKYEEPIVDIWFLKPENRNNRYQIAQAKIEDSYPMYCKPSQIPAVIAHEIGGEWGEFYDRCKDSITQYALASRMCECPWVFKADFQPEAYFRMRWLKQYGTDIDLSVVSSGFVDIEVDVIDRTVPMAPNSAADAFQPVNAATVILPKEKIVALLVLGPRPKHLIHEKFYELLDRQVEQYNELKGRIEEIKRAIREDDPDNAKYVSDFDIRIHMFDFGDEINLIKTIYDYINKYRPTLVFSWNARFDHPYLQYRIEYLGYNPRDIIIPKELKTETLYYKPDRSDNFSMKNAKDWYYISSFSIWLCQMRLFAAIRKSQQERRSYSLSSVGKDIAGIDKLSDTKSGTFREFAYTDLLKFWLYNVRDVVVQYAIDECSSDGKSLVSRAYQFGTAYAKCFQETHIVRNNREFFYEKVGFVQACRLIEEDPNVDHAFKGAFVAPPENNAPTGYIVNGKRASNIMYGVLDADAEAYYPSNKMGLNLDPMSLLYKCHINNNVFLNGTCVNRSFNQEYFWYDTKGKPHAEDMSGPIINAYKNGNIMSVAYNWLGLPSMSSYFEHLDANLKK